MKAPRLAPLISALGVSFFLQNSVLLLFGAQFRTYDSFVLGCDPELFEPGPHRPRLKIRGVTAAIQLLVAARSSLMVALLAVVARTQRRQSDARDGATTARAR